MIVAASGSKHIHNKNGNLTDDGINTYQWDAFGRLSKVVRKSDSVVLGEFRYDAQNRQVYHTAPFADASTYGRVEGQFPIFIIFILTLARYSY